MASTFTDLGIELMATGENAGTWGTKTNANLSLIEQLTGGVLQVSIAGGAGTTALDIEDGALTGTAQQRVIELTGSITGNRIVTWPLLTENFYIIKNGTSGAYTVQLKAASGSGATVTFSATDKGYKLIYLDGVATNTGLFEATIGEANEVTLTGTQTLTNKTLTSPKIGTSILDTNGNELALLTATSSAVNEFTIANGASGNAPRLSATGETNVDLDLLAKGTGHVTVRGDTNAGAIQLNCESNSHGQQIKSQPHSASVTNVMLLPAGADSTLVSLVSTDTLTNKTLTSPKINENVVVSATATEINYSDLATLGTSAASKVLTANANNLTTISGAVLNTEDTLTDASTITWNVINSPVAKVTLGANRTMAAPSGTGPAAGQMISLLVIQDGTGSRTITWNAVYEFPSDTAPTLTTTANLGDIFSFRYNGSKWLLIGQTLALTLS